MNQWSNVRKAQSERNYLFTALSATASGRFWDDWILPGWSGDEGYIILKKKFNVLIFCSEILGFRCMYLNKRIIQIFWMCLLLTWAPPPLWLQMTEIITKLREFGDAFLLLAMYNMCIMDIFSQILAEQLFMTFFFLIKMPDSTLRD